MHQQPYDNQVAIVLILLSIFGILFWYMAWKYLQLLRLKKKGWITYGTITGYTESKDSDGDTWYTPLVEFTTAKNQRISFKAGEADRTPPVTGDTVLVLYDEDRPEACSVYDNKTEFSLRTITFILGGIVLVIVIMLLSAAG